MITQSKIAAAAALVQLFAVPVAFAGAHHGPGEMEPNTFARRSGFKGHEAELGAAVAAAIRETSPTGDAAHDFTGRERELGLALESLIKALNNRKPYQHEQNDALVKAKLTELQFAKENGMLDEWLEHEVETQLPMISRVGTMIEKTGNYDLGLMALTERTACFYQLVIDYRRDGEWMRWKSPYGNVLAVTRQLGQHDFTEQWVHENYTIPLFTKQAEAMGVGLEISEWQADGWLAMRVVPAANRTAAN